MELIVFDLDGTLLNRASEISAYTSETLRRLSERGIAYTVATGRTLHGARSILAGHGFELPQAYKNGVLIWHPRQQRFSSGALLTRKEVSHIVQSCADEDITPFVFTLDGHRESAVYHPPMRTTVERQLIHNFGLAEQLAVRPLDALPDDARITHVNCIGDGDRIQAIVRRIDDEPDLVAYSGIAQEGQQWRWLDLHHSDASKGGAINELKQILGLERVICFGDNDNDLSMFAAADESYAPDNATAAIKAGATAVIGHHDEEGIARFLRERFDLGPV